MLRGHAEVGAGVPCWGSVEVSRSRPRPSLCPRHVVHVHDRGALHAELYQKRHPDINASAYSAYACLAIVIFFSVLGVVRPGPLCSPGGQVHACAHPCPPPLPERDPCSFPSASLAWLPAQLLRRRSGRGGGEGLSLVPPHPCPRGPHRSLARGTQRSGSSSQSSTSLPLLLSTQLYYMGNWKLGEGLLRASTGVGGLGDLASQETLGRCPLRRPEESLGTEFMRPWHSCASRRPWALSAGAAQGLGRKGAWAFEHLPFSQTRGSAIASSTCSTAASGSAGLSTWYLRFWAPPLRSFLQVGGRGGGGRSEADCRGGVGAANSGLLPFFRSQPRVCFPPRIAWCCWSWWPISSTGHCGQPSPCVPGRGGQLRTWPAAGATGGCGQNMACEKWGPGETGVGPGVSIFCGPLNPPHIVIKHRVGVGRKPLPLLLAVPASPAGGHPLLPGGGPTGSSCVPTISPPYLLAIGICNLLLYFAFYIIMVGREG